MSTLALTEFPILLYCIFSKKLTTIQYILIISSLSFFLHEKCQLQEGRELWLLCYFVQHLLATEQVLSNY